MRILALVAAFILGSFTLLAAAQEAPQPDIKVGDRWTYQLLDKLTGEIKGSATLTIYEVTDTEIHQKAQIKTKAPINRVEYLDRQLNLIDNGVYQWKPSTGFFHFPLTIGKEWSQQYEAVAISNESKTRHNVSAKVVAFEKIKVPAGEFDAFKIEYTIRSISTSDADRADSYTKTVRWYSPSVKQVVKQETESVMGGRIREKSGMVLTDFSSQP
jgi:hypothetical protein